MLEEIRRNLYSLQKKISDAAERAGRDPGEVKIVAVTKTVEVSVIRDLLSLGMRDIGENKVQDAKRKHEEIGALADWHFIGHLQKNKVKDALKFSSLIHSVDNIELLEEIDKRAGSLDKIQKVLLQVNFLAEERFGFKPIEVFNVVERSMKLSSVAVEGLMTMAPLTDDSDEIRAIFSGMRGLKNEVISKLPEIENEFTELSMGMSNDYEIAVEENSTIVRVGSAIFKGGLRHEH